VILLLIIVALFPLVIAKIQGNNKLSPIILFSLGQFGGMAFALTKITSEMPDPKLITWAVFWGMNGAYIIGYMLSNKYFKLPEAEVSSHQIGKKQVAFILGVALLFFLSAAYSRFAVGTWPIFAKHIDKARDGFFGQNKIINFTIQFSYSAAALLAYGLFRRGAPRWLFFLLWGCIPLMFILCAARNMILFSAFCLLFGHEAMRKPMKIRWGIGSLVVFILIFIITTYVRAGGKAILSMTRGNNAKVVAVTVMAPTIYSYVANNFWNLDYGISKMETDYGHPHTFGYSSFSGVSYYLSQNKSIEEYWRVDGLLNERSSKVSGLNTISYQWPLYKDFGLPIGCVIVFVIGAWCSKIYRLACKTKRADYVYLAAFATFWSGYSPFIFGPSAPQNIIYLILAPIVYLVFRESESILRQQQEIMS
jgi:oligosaccharide repeat unit polymerase